MTTPNEDQTATHPIGPDEPTGRPRKSHPVAVVLSSILGLIGVALLIGGVALISIHAIARDDDGYYTSDTELVESDGYAITTDEIDLGTEPTGIAPEDIVSSVRLRAESTNGGPVFLGIARTNDVGSYLGGVSHSEFTDITNGDIEVEDVAGGKPSGAPGEQDFWTVQAEGTGRQTLEWEPENGTWSAVVMKADAAQGVSVDLDAGADIGWLIWLGVGLTIVGLIMTAAGAVLVIRAVR